MMRKIWIAMCFFAPLGVIAQEVAPKPPPPQVPMVIEPADADAFRDIVDSTIPPRYSSALVRWYNAIVQRQVKQADAAKTAKPEREQ